MIPKPYYVSFNVSGPNITEGLQLSQISRWELGNLATQSSFTLEINYELYKDGHGMRKYSQARRLVGTHHPVGLLSSCPLAQASLDLQSRRI